MRFCRVLVLGLLPSIAAAQPVQPVQLIHRFTASASHPRGAMVETPDGSLYGLTGDAIYRVAPGGAVSIVARTTGGSDSTIPGLSQDFGPDAGLVRGPDGALYGTRKYGGSGGRGVVFRFDPATGTVRTLHAFDGANGGANPVGGVTVAGGFLYGAAGNVIFRTDPATGATTTIVRFPYFEFENPNRFQEPSSPLTLGLDGMLYGLTRYGSGSEGGTIYRVDPGTGTLGVVHRFDAQSSYPAGRIFRATDGRLYGASQEGTVWRFTPVTGAFEVLHTFSGQEGKPGPVVMTPDGSLYGTTHLPNNNGYIPPVGLAIFRLRPVAGVYTFETVRAFDAVTGEGVRVDLRLATNGFLYGYAQNGGPSGTGSIYRFQPGSNPLVFSVLHTFAPTTTWIPSAPVEGAGRLLYGTLSRGGANQRGAIYQLNRANDEVTIIGEMPGSVPGTEGVYNSALVWDQATARLYGTNTTNTTTAVEHRIVQVAESNGAVTIPLQTTSVPLGFDGIDSAMVRDGAGDLYFVRRTAIRAVLYRYAPATQTLTVAGVPPDPGAFGESSLSAPVIGADGRVYVRVMTAVEYGTLPLCCEVTIRVMRVDPASSTLEEVVNLGAIASGPLVLGADGGLYLGSGSQIRRIEPVARTSQSVCAVPNGTRFPLLTALPDARLVSVVTLERLQRLAICTPSTGAVEVRSLPTGIGKFWSPLVYASGWLYGATQDGEAPFVVGAASDRPSTAGALVRLSLDTPLPTTDADADGLPNTWETLYGLDPFDGAADAGASGDADGDGRTNAQEYADGTHPRGVLVRHFAEGATGAFFHTRFDLVNPASAQAATVLLRFLTDAGVAVSHNLVIPPAAHVSLDPSTLAGLANATFSTVVEADQVIGVDRTMTWDATGYGSTLETGVEALSTTWYFAEGSTSGPFALFYLLENPHDTAVTATVRYLRPGGLPPIDKTYTIAPASRRTIAVDAEGAELASTDVSAVITASAPIVAERAMYFTQGGQPFAAGHESAGVTAPAQEWFLAEGATGAFFDLFVLIANPNASAATVNIEYLLVGGGTLTKTYAVPANSRVTVWVDDEELPAGSGQKPLADVAVSMAVRSTNAVPIIVERTMWWPGPAVTSNFWYEASNTPGATVTATRWLVSAGEIDAASGTATYVLIANPSSTPALVTVAQVADDSLTPATQVYTLPPKSRTTVAFQPPFASHRFGVLVESLGAPAVPVVVEHATYSSPGGVTWAAGGAALAAPLP